MKQWCMAWALAVMLAGAGVGQTVPVTGVEGKTLKDLEGTSTLVTVVLKDSSAKDSNLRVLEVHSGDLVVLTQNNERFCYLFEDIQEVRVQGGKVEPRRLILPKMAALRAEDQKIVDRAKSRAREVYAASNDNQDRKIRAAVLLSLQDDPAALEYLRTLAESNDMKTQLEAARALYLVGDRISETVIRAGLESGNRVARARAAMLAGLSGYHEATDLLNTMFMDRAAELCAPATRALAYLQDRSITPRLIQLVGDSNPIKSEAAMFSLKRLGGEDVTEQLLARLSVAPPQERYRIAVVLHAMGLEEGRRELAAIFREVPTLTPEAALILARDKDWDATQFLRARLARRENPTLENLLYRARNAASLFIGGDPSALAVFQELLRESNAEVKHLICDLVIEINDRRLLAVIQPLLENIDNDLAISACTATMAMAMPEFRGRLLDIRDEP